VRIDSSHIDELIRIQNFEPSIVELDDTFLTQTPQHPVDVDASKTDRVSNVLLGQREMHFFNAVARPSHSIANK